MSKNNHQFFNVLSDKILVFILFVISIISTTNLKFLQEALEILSVFYLLVGISQNKKMLKIHVNLVIVFFLFSFVSLLFNPFLEFLLNFKIYLLAILVLLYFQDKVIQTIFLDIIVYINIILILVKIQFDVFLIPVAGLNIGFQDLLDSRPLGLFLNPHLSAYVIGIYFIFKSIQKKNILYDLIGGVLILLIGSKFTLFAFVSNFLSKFKFLFKFLLLGILVFFMLLVFILSTDYIYLFPVSGRFIFQQMLDPSSYQALINWYPVDYNRYLSTQIQDIDDIYGKANGNEIGNEIQLFTLYIEGGFILASYYLINLYRALNFFRIFLFFSLIHYGFVTTPFILFLIINFENILLKNYSYEIRSLS